MGCDRDVGVLGSNLTQKHVRLDILSSGWSHQRNPPTWASMKMLVCWNKLENMS